MYNVDLYNGFYLIHSKVYGTTSARDGVYSSLYTSMGFPLSKVSLTEMSMAMSFVFLRRSSRRSTQSSPVDLGRSVGDGSE